MNRRISRYFALPFLVSAVVVLSEGSARAGTTLRTYFVGNSLTEAIDQPQVQEMAAVRRNALEFGKHERWGASLQYLWENPTDTSAVQSPYDNFQNAFTKFQWDVISLQPFARPMMGASGDRAQLANFINLARVNSPNAQFYLYEQWPQKASNGALDFDANWLAQATGLEDETIRTRDYYEDLTHVIRDDFSSLPKSVLMVPAGDVMYELNQRMKRGEVPGFTSINQFYSDNIHLNPVGSYMLSMTFYAALFKDSPLGLPFDESIISNPVVAEQIQDAAWDVVRSNPLTGVPEPTSIAMISLIALTGLARRRR